MHDKLMNDECSISLLFSVELEFTYFCNLVMIKLRLWWIVIKFTLNCKQIKNFDDIMCDPPWYHPSWCQCYKPSISLLTFSLASTVMMSDNFQTLSKNFKIQIFIAIFGFSMKKCIQMSTNKPSVGPVILETSHRF